MALNTKNNYTNDFLKKITQMGALEYSIDKIVNILDEDICDIKDFEKELNNESSKVFKAYKKGKDKADFLIDQRLFEMARNGDLKALEKYERKKTLNNLNK